MVKYPLWEALSQHFQEKNDQIALVIAGRPYSYSQIHHWSQAIRIALQAQKTSGPFVAIVTHNHPLTYAAIWALWQEGKAYVPLSPLYPSARKVQILQQAHISTLCSCKAEASDITGYSEILDLNQVVQNGSAAFPGQPLWPDAEAPVCMLFTSGSTGVPKGVPYTLRNAACTLDAFFALNLGLHSGDRFLQAFELTFDMSMLSFLPAWCLGASVWTVSSSSLKYLDIYRVLHKGAITFAALVPSTLALLRPNVAEIHLPALRCMMVGGEPFPLDLAMDWLAALPNARLLNISGPCETTMACMAYEVHRDPKKNKTHKGVLAFGKPWKNTTALLVNEQQEEVQEGEEGELCFAGEHVMSGYWGQADLNRSIFFEKEINGRQQRFYRTGDRAFCDASGDYYTCGRLDHQYKIQGFKVELGEIEHLARKVLASRQAIAVVKQQAAGQEIHLFAEGASGMLERLKQQLAEALPPYMMPAAITMVDQWPYNTSGKIDRQALLQLCQPDS